MKATLLLIIAVTLCGTLSAQFYTLNWASSFSPFWADIATSRNANNIGGSGISCNVSISKSGGIFTNVYGTYGGPATPTVTSSTFVVPSSSSNMQISMEYSAASQYTDITFTFSTLVYNLRFKIADIDRLTNTLSTYFDRVTITGSTGFLTVQPTLKKYDAITDPNFLIISGNVAQVNTAMNMAGNAASNATGQKGTIDVDFGSKAVVSFTIRYDNAPGVDSDPGVQNISIGNIYFLKTAALPVQLSLFEGQQLVRKNRLKWHAENESDVSWYIIERSLNGTDFHGIGMVAGTNSNLKATYQFDDIVNNTNKIFYRLKMVDYDGSFSYSRVITISPEDPIRTKIFPTVFTSSVMVCITSLKEENLQLSVTDAAGRIVYRQKLQAKKGNNEFLINLPPGFLKGQYFVLVGNEKKGIGIIK